MEDDTWERILEPDLAVVCMDNVFSDENAEYDSF